MTENAPLYFQFSPFVSSSEEDTQRTCEAANLWSKKLIQGSYCVETKSLNHALSNKLEYFIDINQHLF